VSTYGQDGGADPNIARLQEVERAWDERSRRIHSVELRTDIQELVKGRGNRPLDPSDDPLAERLPKNDRTLGRVAYYAYEDGKIAIASFSDSIDWDDPERLQSLLLQITYDGKDYGYLIQSSGRPLATITDVEKKQFRMYIDFDYLAVGVWLFPKKLLHHEGWKIDDAVVDERHVLVDGISCLRIRVPRRGGNVSLTVDVDPTRDYVPVRWQTWVRERLWRKLTVEYEERKEIGAVPTAWKFERFKNGKGDESRAGTIADLEVNHDVDDRRFKHSLPVGTHLVKEADGARSYFLQTRDGLAPMDEKLFGKNPSAVNP
jgi:hypothetical protein